MNYVFVLNEGSIFPFLWRIVTGRRVYISSVTPALFISGWLIRKVGDWATRSGLAKHIQEIVPDGNLIWADMPDSFYLGYVEKVVRVIDATVSEEAPEKLEQGENSYQLAALKVASSCGQVNTFFAKALYDFLDADPAMEITLSGADLMLIDIFESLNGVPGRLHISPWRRGIRAFNAVISVTVAMATIASLLRNTRLRNKTIHHALAVVDVTPPFSRTKKIIESVLDDVQSRVLFIVRNKNAYPGLKNEALQGVRWANIENVCYSLKELLPQMKCTIFDSLKIYSNYRHQAPAQFFQTARLVFVAIQYRGFFNGHDFKIFLGQDEMNPDHIIRSRELRKLGRVPLGLINGDATNGISFVHRYIDYDIAYMVADYTYRHYLHPYWPQNSILKPVGSIRCVAANNYPGPEPLERENVLLLVKPREEGSRGLLNILPMARAFPEMEFTVAIKAADHIPAKRAEAFNMEISRLPQNVRVSYDNTYELIYRHKYVISTMSCMISEAIHMGAITFFLDIYPENFLIIYRDFPDLHCKDISQVIARIDALESGVAIYPRDKLAEIAVVNKPGFAETFAEDLTALLGKDFGQNQLKQVGH